MQITLRAIEGPAQGQTIVVPDGRKLQIGRTKWADVCLANDPGLAEVHFEVECHWRGGRIRDLQSGRGTFVNDAQIGDSPLRDGDRVTAGETTFGVQVEDERLGGGPDADETSAATPPPPSAADYYRPLEWSEAAQALFAEGLSPAAYFDLLLSGGLYIDAIRFLAFWLPKPTAVAWACRCVRSVFGGSDALRPGDRKSLEAAEAWAADPGESQRRAAEAAAQAGQFEGPASCVAAAAFFSGGSLTAPDLPPVPPPDTATAKSLTAALMMAATHGPPPQAPQRYLAFLTEGRKLVAG